jgi:hypothetical protein
LKQFRALLGIDEKGKVVPLIAEAGIHPIGTRFERGDNAKFPTSVYIAWRGENVTPEQYIKCLEDLEEFCKRHLNQPQKKNR